MSLVAHSPPLRDLNGRQINWIGAGYLLVLSSLPGQTIFIAQFNSALRENFSLSNGEFGLLYTAATLISSICLIWAGGLVDRIAPRTLGLICITALALVAVLMSRVNSILALGIALFGLRFFGQGMMSHIAMTAMARWFNRFRGRALAFAQMGFPTGEAILPYVLTLAIIAYGWRQVWLAAAVFLIVVLAPVIAFLLNDPPDGKRALARGIINPDAQNCSAPTGSKWNRSAILRDPIFYLIILGVMGPAAIGTLFIFHQAHLSQIKGWDIGVFTAFFPALSLSVVVFAIISGLLVDRLGAWRLLPFALIPQGFGTLALGLFDPVWTIPVFFVSFGITGGIMSPVAGALWAEIYGTAHLGKIRALATSAMVLASAVGPGLAGVLIDLKFDLDRQAFFYAAYCFVVSGAYFVFLKKFKARAEIMAYEQTTAQGLPLVLP
ncbi:Uncharacterized MFS-type transporter [hydrothermal vent metagenome]|uniref:Uncharacterized MFS-type transporter n=1 Tax=hydrothermal vent metagenome TaxID=652676 RepID=A0A3B0UKG4_9ZZZZ